MVGAIVGIRVGFLVGIAVIGAFVGVDVGAATGALVGAAIGAGVLLIRPFPLSFLDFFLPLLLLLLSFSLPFPFPFPSPSPLPFPSLSFCASRSVSPRAGSRSLRAVERMRLLLAALQLEVFTFSSSDLYQKCPFQTFYGLYNILRVLKASKLQTRPSFTAIALGR